MIRERVNAGLVRAKAQGKTLYQIPKIVTPSRFPNHRGSDSRWRTMEVRHGGIASWRFRRVAAAGPGEEGEGWPSGSALADACCDLRRRDADRGREDRRRRTSDHPGLGVAVQ